MKKSKKGLFITFEGPDGSGKSTVANLLFQKLSKNFPSIKFNLTREPGGKNNAIAEDIRDILLNKIDYKVTDRTEALLFAASRAQHVNDFIIPHLNNGEVILCDRYIHSSLVYQGYARKIGFKQIFEINDFGCQSLMPDLTILLMINPEDGIKRIKANKNRDFNRLDKEEIALHKKVYDGYKKIIKEFGKNIIVIDASKSINEVFNNTYEVINKYIKKNYGF